MSKGLSTLLFLISKYNFVANYTIKTAHTQHFPVTIKKRTTPKKRELS